MWRERWLKCQRMTSSHIPGRKEAFHFDLALMTNLVLSVFPSTNNCHQHCLCANTVCLFPGWKTGSQFTQQTWSSLRGSWSSTPRKCVICFTWSFLWTQIQTSDCLAEVLMSPSHKIFQTSSQHINNLTSFPCSSPRHDQRERPGADSYAVYNICQACFWRVLFACKYDGFHWLCAYFTVSNLCQHTLRHLVLSDKEVCRRHHSKGGWQYG